MSQNECYVCFTGLHVVDLLFHTQPASERTSLTLGKIMLTIMILNYAKIFSKKKNKEMCLNTKRKKKKSTGG